MKARIPLLRIRFRIFHFAFIICLLATGCNIFGPRPEPPDAKAPPVPTGHFDTPTPELLVKYLNNQAALLQSIQTTDLTLDVRSQGNGVGLDGGTLLCHKPRYF